MTKKKYDPEKEIEKLCEEHKIVFVAGTDGRQGHDNFSKIKKAGMLKLLHSKLLEFIDSGKVGDILVVDDFGIPTFRQDIEETKNESIEKEGLEFYYDKDLIDMEFPEPEWIIRNQIPVGEVGILAGKRGDRKTFYALYQAICSSAGLDCVEDAVKRKNKVLYVSEEDGKNALLPRAKAIKKGMGLENESLDIIYFTLNNLKLDMENDKFTKFLDILKNFRPDLIIIDCLQRCVTFDVDIDNKSISEFFTGTIKPLQKLYGGTWLFIHHLRKGITGGKPPEDLLDEIRGGSEIVNFPRFVLICQTPKQSPNLMVFTPVKLSYSELPDPKVISFTNSEEEKSIVISYEGLPKDVLKTELKCAEAIKEFLFRNQITEFRTRDIKERAEEVGYKKSMISNGLKLLVEQGFVQKPKVGFYVVKGGGKQTKI